MINQTKAVQMPPLLPAALRHDPWVDHEGRVLMELCVVGDYVKYEDHIAYVQAYAAIAGQKGTT